MNFGTPNSRRTLTSSGRVSSSAVSLLPVIGVTPESFRGPNVWLRADLYVPLAMEPTLAGESRQSELEDRGLRVLMVQGRLKPGVRVGQAAAEKGVISQQLAQAYPKTNRTCSLAVATHRQAQIQQISLSFTLVVFMSALSGWCC